MFETFEVLFLRSRLKFQYDKNYLAKPRRFFEIN